MDKLGGHLQPMQMPTGQQAKQVPKSEDVMDFGFGKAQQPQPKHIGLDEAYAHWQKHQNAANMNSVLHAADSVINRALTQYAGGDKSMRIRAKKLAIDAIKTYDPKHRTQLRTHMMIRLKPLQREYTRRTSPLSIPERVQLDQLRLRNAENELTETLGREPSDDEIADYTGLSARRIAHVRSYANKVLSESQMRTSEGELQLPATEHITQSDIWVEFVHHDLDAKDKKILEWKTGYGGHDILSTNEIARRLNLTPSAVSQRAAKIAVKLEEGSNVATG